MLARHPEVTKIGIMTSKKKISSPTRPWGVVNIGRKGLNSHDMGLYTRNMKVEASAPNTETGNRIQSRSSWLSGTSSSLPDIYRTSL